MAVVAPVTHAPTRGGPLVMTRRTIGTIDARAQPVAALAESWTYSDDRRTLRFRLRCGVKFHSGRPFTAESVKWNIERAQDPKNEAAVGGELMSIQVVPVDSTTVDVRTPDDSYPHSRSPEEGFGDRGGAPTREW